MKDLIIEFEEKGLKSKGVIPVPARIMSQCKRDPLFNNLLQNLTHFMHSQVHSRADALEFKRILLERTEGENLDDLNQALTAVSLQGKAKKKKKKAKRKESKSGKNSNNQNNNNDNDQNNNDDQNNDDNGLISSANNANLKRDESKPKDNNNKPTPTNENHTQKEKKKKKKKIPTENQELDVQRDSKSKSNKSKSKKEKDDDNNNNRYIDKQLISKQDRDKRNYKRDKKVAKK